jgi:hypothetical protein
MGAFQLQMIGSEIGLSLLQGNAKPLAFHVVHRFQRPAGFDQLLVVVGHTNVVRQDQAAGFHQGEQLVQIIDVALLVSINKKNINRFHYVSRSFGKTQPGYSAATLP